MLLQVIGAEVVMIIFREKIDLPRDFPAFCHYRGMTIEKLEEKIGAFTQALVTNAINLHCVNNQVLADCMKDSLIELQAELVRALHARVETVKSKHAVAKEAFEEVGGDFCETCDNPIFEEEESGNGMCEACCCACV